jgi:hypothetical protein
MKILAAVAIGFAVCAAGATLARASCPGAGAPVNWSTGDPTFEHGGKFVNCGDNGLGYYWMNHMGIQRTINQLSIANNSDGAGGIDSGILIGDLAILFNAGGGTYYAFSDWINDGVDGCITNSNVREADVTYCQAGGSPSVGAMNYIVSGQDTTDPALALAAVLSVDFNPTTGSFDLGFAGAPSIDGNACGADGTSFNANDVPCGVIPKPQIGVGGGACDALGCTLQINVPSNPTPPPIIDDCAVAASRTLPSNCPRNLGGDYLLMFKRGSCAVKPTDTRTFILPAAINPGTGTDPVPRNFFPLSREDRNLNGVLDTGEDGTDGGQANGVLDHYALAAGSLTPVRIPRDPAGQDCLYLALAFRVDPNPSSQFLAHEPVISTYVSMNGSPVSSNSATPSADKVSNLVAAKRFGQTEVSWETSAEFSVAGFNLIGTKRGGRDVKLNARLIPAKKGTTGEGASYSMTITARDLRGSTAVYVEVVKTNGTTERFGPVSFK